MVATRLATSGHRVFLLPTNYLPGKVLTTAFVPISNPAVSLSSLLAPSLLTWDDTRWPNYRLQRKDCRLLTDTFWLFCSARPHSTTFPHIVSPLDCVRQFSAAPAWLELFGAQQQNDKHPGAQAW